MRRFTSPREFFKMALAVINPTSIELFYSYSHLDEALCKELQKHLTNLKRSGLIHDWYDRKIEPGSKWAIEIEQAIERAGIVLLLISADFFASQFILEIELPFALARHSAGQTTVIPVLLRPVEWRDSPISKLQVLPSHARPVTLWPNRDEAFSDVAGSLREFLYNRRLREAREVLPAPAVTYAVQERVLDAAVASTVVKDEPTDLVVMIRLAASGGLRAILQIDRSYSPLVQDVRSKTFELDFPVDTSSKILPVALALVLESPDFFPLRQLKKIRVPPGEDSDVSVFMLTPMRLGTLRLSLELLLGDVEIGSSILVTKSVSAASEGTEYSYAVTSLKFRASPNPKSPNSPRVEEYAVSAVCAYCGSTVLHLAALYCERCGRSLSTAAANDHLPSAVSSPSPSAYENRYVDPRIRGRATGAATDSATGKSPFFALFLSFLIPGVGQVYNGDIKRFLPMFLVGIFGYSLALMPIFGVFAILGIHIWSMINAYNVASGKTPLA
jgi:TIR domain